MQQNCTKTNDIQIIKLASWIQNIFKNLFYAVSSLVAVPCDALTERLQTTSLLYNRKMNNIDGGENRLIDKGENGAMEEWKKKKEMKKVMT